MSDNKENEQPKKFIDVLKDKLYYVKKIIDTDLAVDGEKPSIAETRTVEEEKNSEDVKCFDFKIYANKIRYFAKNEKNIKLLNGVLAAFLVVFTAALIFSVYARQKIDVAYEDVINQNEGLVEKNDALKDEYDKLRPKYEMLSEEYDKLNNSAEEAKNAELSDFEDENTEETKAEEAAQ
jgi:hypothetical protein